MTENERIAELVRELAVERFAKVQLQARFKARHTHLYWPTGKPQ